MYTATENCSVIASVVQQMAYVTPKRTTLRHSNLNSYKRVSGTDSVTFTCALAAGEKIYIYASAQTQGINEFVGTLIVFTN